MVAQFKAPCPVGDALQGMRSAAEKGALCQVCALHSSTSPLQPDAA